MESKNSSDKLGSHQPTCPPPPPSPPRGKPNSLSKSPRMRESFSNLLNPFIGMEKLQSPSINDNNTRNNNNINDNTSSIDKK